MANNTEELIVIPRLDDLQCGWSPEFQTAQNTIISHLTSKKIPLTVGMIMGNAGNVTSPPWPLDDHTLKIIAENRALIEVGSHTLQHANWSNQSKKTYLQLLKKGHGVLKEAGFDTRTLIMPENYYDSELYATLKDPSCPYNIISTAYDKVNKDHVPSYEAFPQCDPDVPLYWVPATCSPADFRNLQLWSSPYDAVTGPGPTPDYLSIKDSAESKPKVKGKSWACIMMHPQDFQLNDKFMTEYEIKTFLNDYFGTIDPYYTPVYMTMSQFVEWSKTPV